MSISKRTQRAAAVVLTLVMVMTVSVTNVNAAVKKSTITLKNCAKPATINMGEPFYVKGKIKAGSKIFKVEAGIVSQKTGKWLYKYTKTKINRKTFNLKKADATLKFRKLKAGTYYYRIKVKLKGKQKKTVLNKKFTVVDNRAATVKVKIADSEDITLSGCLAPGTYNVGNEFVPKGIVSCTEKINKVEVGIVIAATNKWSEYKYTKKVNADSFDLSTTAGKLKFDELPGGEYMYRMYAHTDDGVKIVFNRQFTVIPSNKPRKAVRWAINIANDDTFTYGKKPIANAIGCYFCGTNDRKVSAAKKAKMKNPERYEKTYVCLTFIGAAYAHGAGDPEILTACQNRKMTMYETNDNFSKFSCWMKIGSCKDLTVGDLLPGDVIIKWSDHNDNNGHVCMYIGNNNLVEASGGTWKATSIAVKTGAAASRLLSLSTSSKNYVMRYRH